nr:hypothetical protein BaRGS_032951 [Batillaria attramentaria]
MTLMIPGTNTCRPGWTREYHGHLMAGYHDHTSGTEFICMDGAMEADHSSHKNDNGKLFYYVLGLVSRRTYKQRNKLSDGGQLLEKAACCKGSPETDAAQRDRTPYETTLMIPGTNTCRPGWTREYHGHLMAGYYTFASGTEFICMDGAMEADHSSHKNDDGYFWLMKM